MPNCPGCVALVLERRRDSGIGRLQAEIRPRHTDLGQAGPDRVLSADECGAAGRAALFAVVVGETNAIRGDPIDIGGAITHQSFAIAANVSRRS